MSTIDQVSKVASRGIESRLIDLPCAGRSLRRHDHFMSALSELKFNKLSQANLGIKDAGFSSIRTWTVLPGAYEDDETGASTYSS